MFHFSGKTLTCGIDLGDDMKGSHGLETGFAYEVLKDFARDHNCRIRIITADKDNDLMESLKKGDIDLLMMHHEDAQGNEELLLSDTIIDCSALAVTNGRKGHIREVNEWLSTYTSSEEFEADKKLFFRPLNPIKRAERGIMTETISPYDELLKQYASELGWDWRMLAAVVYQESKFSINSRSSRGARGLMQVMPSTAEYYSIDDLLNPEKNLKAGTSHMKRLQRMFEKDNMDKSELVKFTLAAYNAGEGRIADCRRFAEAKGSDSSRWDEIVSLIPLMREDSILEEESVKLGKFQGYETIAYIENIMDLYNAFCTICPSI
jgi:membrane-bound lytic murein transglycosylase F